MWHNVEQNSDEWFKLRIGKATSSNFSKIMAYDCKKWGQGAIEYAEKIALEIATGERDETNFKSYYMERGHELEPLAIQMYEKLKFCSVTNGGFFSDNDCFGDSPDGIINDIGCLEVKSVVPKTQWKRIKSGKYDETYKWQIYGHLLIGGFKWCDFVSFCPEMPENKQLLTFRIERDEEELNKLNERLIEFWGLVQEHVKILTEEGEK